MKSLSRLMIASMIGVAVFIGCHNNISYADTPISEDKVVVTTDDSIFKVAHIRPERTLGEYRLFKGDTIKLLAMGHASDDIGIEKITVGVDGMAQIPYVGNVKLVGLTLDESRDLIQTKLSKYFKIPELYVYLESYGTRKVYVMGNVNNPGIKEMAVDNMNIYAAISSASGVDKRGRSKHIQLLRQIDDKLYFKEVNIDAFVKKHDLSQNIAIEDGDIIYVPDSGKVIFNEDIAPYINIYAIYRSIVK